MKLELKIRLLSAVFALAFGLIILRSGYWQIVRGESMAIKADQQHFFSLEIPPNRGIISSRDGFSLVGNRDLYLLYANLHELKLPPREIAVKLVPALIEANSKVATNSSEAKILENNLTDRLSLPNTVWVKLAPGLSISNKSKIESLGIAGLSFITQKFRDYPEASMSAHLLGFISESKRGFTGNFGVEEFYDKELSGKPGRLLEEKDAFQRPILIGEILKQDQTDGSNLELTIDRGVQRFVEQYLEEGISQWGAKGGTAIVINPQNGEILASASFPRYDPANFAFYQTSLFKDPLIADLYEPGSIIKPLIMAAAINEGKVEPSARCPECAAPVTIGDYTVHTFNNVYHPNLTMGEVLVNSDNTGMIWVGKTLGFLKLYDYLNRFGFNDRTGVDLAGEVTGKLRPKSGWYPIDQATVTFGQGIAVTPVQMVRAWSTLANGGKLITPHVVRAIITASGRKDLIIKPAREVISESTSRVLSQMLVRVANESPLHFPKERTPGLEKFRIAAKSGTAQIPIAGHYEEGRTIGSVIGFAPADNPRFLVLVKLDSPSVRPWGSDTAGPVFFNIVNDLLHHYNIEPTEQ